jgi:kynurenine formamidase
MPLEAYVAWATVLRPGPCAPLTAITAATLAGSGPEPRAGDAVLIWTDWATHWNEPDYASQHPFLTADAAEWLVARGVRCVGMDTAGLMDPRIDLRPGHAEDVPIVDRILMEAGITYVAALVNVNAIEAGRPLFVAVPLKLVGLDGAPVRAVAIEGI